jgi:tRNA G26 N,N-dimethylase Trm1
MLRLGGQLWSGSLHDKEFIARMAKEGADEKSKKVLDAALDEIDGVPYYFKADEISSKLRTNPHSIAKIIEKLRAAGYRASRTPFNPGAFKTDARLDRIIDVLR